MTSRHSASRVIGALINHQQVSIHCVHVPPPIQSKLFTFSICHPYLAFLRTTSLFLSTASRSMSDEAYSSFLDQANQDSGASKTRTQSKSKKMSTKAVDTEVPAALQNVEVDYTSESDEPFEPVSLKWEGKNMPSESSYLWFTSSTHLGRLGKNFIADSFVLQRSSAT